MGKGGYNGGSTVIHACSGWVGRGSVTSQPADMRKRPPTPAKSKGQTKAGKVGLGGPKTGGGLTIAEMAAKADKKVCALESEIAKTKQRLGALERDLVRALNDAEAARNMPRRTTIGRALHQAEKAKSQPKPVKSKSRKGDLTEAERKAEREARQKYRDAPKEVDVEHRVAGVIVSKRIVQRS